MTELGGGTAIMFMISDTVTVGSLCSCTLKKEYKAELENVLQYSRVLHASSPGGFMIPHSLFLDKIPVPVLLDSH